MDDESVKHLDESLAEGFAEFSNGRGHAGNQGRVSEEDVRDSLYVQAVLDDFYEVLLVGVGDKCGKCF